MSLGPNIPTIAIITPECEEDEDHNLIEALTDVEALEEEEFENKSHRRKNCKKLKIRIKVTENTCTTDLEDFEASDNEEDPIGIMRHEIPISLDDLDLEGGTFEESFKTQVRTSKEWEASRKPADPESKALETDVAQQGKTTSTAHYLVINEEISLVQIPVDVAITGLFAQENNVDSKPIYDQTNALIQSESRAEPYHHHTEKYYKIEKLNDDEKQTTSGKEERKRKKGILGTIKTFVGKSLDHSDSESEKSPKKEKKLKKDKKKTKTTDSELPPEVPVRPPRKPKLPTPTEERKYADIPYFEASPSDLPPQTEMPTNESTPFKYSEKYNHSKMSEVLVTVPVTDLDDTDSDVPENIKNQAKEIVSDVITDGEKAVTEQLQKSPKTRKRKVVIVEEKVYKTFTPAFVEEEEFSIIIDPTKKGSPKKTRETFTLNIDESIGKIEKEILEKSPILPDEKLIKASAQIEAPVRPPRIKEHVYEDIEEPVISYPPENLGDVSEYFKFSYPYDIKTVTTDLIQNEINFAGWEDDKYNLFNVGRSKVREESKEKITDSQKMKRKHGKLFGLFGKASKDADDSDDESKKEIIEKQDKEISKEKIKAEVQKSPKLKKNKSKEKSEKVEADITETQISPKKTKGKDKEDKRFLGLFRKGKKDDAEVKPAFSESVIKDMIDSTAFLKEEVDKYHDVKPAIISIIHKDPEKFVNTDKIGDSDSHKEIHQGKQNISEETLISMQESKSFLLNEIDCYHDVRVIANESEAKHIKHSTEKDQSNICEIKPVENLDITREILENVEGTKNLGKYSIIKESSATAELNKSAEKFKEKQTEDKPTIFNEEKSSPKKSKDRKEGRGFFGLFKKKSSEEKEIEPKVEKTKEHHISSEPTVSMIHDSNSFLNDEIKMYHDVRPLIQSAISREELLNQKSTSDNEATGLLMIESSDEKPIETKVEKSEEIALSKSALRNMHESDSLLKEEKISTEEMTKKIKGKPKLSENVIRNMHDSDAFLRDEIKIYHDVRPIIQEKAIRKDEEFSTEKSKKKHKEDSTGLFGLSSEELEIEKAIEDIKKKLVLSQSGIGNSHDSDTFLKDEIKIYHDVRPIIQEKAISKEEKTSIEQSKEIQTENIIKNMQDSDAFLKDEIRIYHDVRPIIQETTITKDEESATVKSKEKHKEGSPGLFGLFKKKSSKEREIEEQVQKTKDRPVLSESVIRDMHDSDAFLNDEIKMYHDVRPIIQEETISKEEKTKIEQSKEKQTDDSSGLFGLFKKKSKDKKIEEVEKTKDRPVLSESAIRDMNESDTFLKDEIEIYHDVRPIIQDTTIIKDQESSTEKTKEKHKERSTGLFGLFKKKSSKEREIEEQVEKTKDRPALSESVIKNMQDSDAFLKDEIKIYHDVRPVIQEKAILKEEKVSIEQSKEKQTDDPTGLFGLFKKKSSKENKTEEEVEKIKDRPVLSESVIRDMHDSDTFLIDEIEKYHDVRPIIQDTTITKDEESSTEKSKKKSSVEIEIIEHIEKTKNKPMLSESVIKNMHDSDAFLKDEITIYHDVRPIIQKTATMEDKESSTEKLKEKHKEGSTGLFGLFKKKSSKEREIEEQVEKTKDRPVLSESVIKNMQDSDAFIKDEIKIYHDVRPIIQENAILQEEKTSIEQSEEKQTDDSTGLFGLFKKKSKDKKIEEVKKTKDRPVLSESVIKEMHDSDTFLQDEIKIYHDVRPIIQDTVILKDDESSIKKSKEKHREGSTGLFGLFKKKSSKEREIEEQVEKTKDRPVLSESVIKNMQGSDAFLKDEIKIYHDVRPIIQEKAILKEEKTSIEQSKEKQTDDSTGLFGVFKKKSSKETNIEEVEKTRDKPVLSENVIRDMHDSNAFLNDEITIYHDVRPIIPETATTKDEESSTKKLKEKDQDDSTGLFGLFKKKSSKEREIEEQIGKTKDRPVLSERVIKNMQDSDAFLKDEIKIYHDVRPIIQETATMKDEVFTTEKSKEKHKESSPGLFGMFKKKSSKEREIEEQVQKSKDTPVLSESVIKNMQDSDAFLKDEIKVYHDVRPIIQDTTIIKDEQFSTEKSKERHKEGSTGLIGLFKKKSSKEREIEEQVQKTKDKPVLSESALRDIQESVAFLNDEIKIYHDVRPIIQKEAISKEGKSSIEQPKGEQTDDSTGFFGLFKKKSSNDKNIEEEVEKTKDRPILSESVIKDMHHSDTFLNEEIAIYHDVRPIIQDTTVTKVEESSTEKSKEKHKEGSAGLFGLFKKKSSQEREINEEVEKTKDKPVLLESVIKDMQDSDAFLSDEIKIYHDVRPVVQEVVTSKLEKTSIEQSKEKQTDDSTGLFGLFKKKSKKHDIEEEVEKIKNMPVLSESVIKDMHDSDTFLNDEITIYHDVRPIIQDTTVTKDEESSTEKSKEKHKEGSAGLFGLLKKKSSKEREIKEEVEKIKDKPELSESVIRYMQDSDAFLSDEIKIYHDVRPVVHEEVVSKEEKTSIEQSKEKQTDDSTGLFGLFKKKSKKHDIEEEVEKIKNMPVLSESVIRDMHDSDTFLNDEITIYHDVRPIIQDTTVTKDEESSTEKSKEKNKEDSAGLFGLLKKKSSKEREIKEELEKTKDKLVLSESVIRDMQDSDAFLSDEIQIYHDVRPVVHEEVVSKEEKTPIEQPKEKQTDDSTGLFGLFKKKSKKNIVEEEVEKIKVMPVLSESVIRDMHDSDTFLNNEITIYHDVRPIIQDTTVTKDEESSTEKSKEKHKEGSAGLFGLLKKKSSKEREIKEEVEKTTDTPVLSESVIRDMQDSDAFLSDEIKIYHDVRPVVQEEVTSKEEKASIEQSKEKQTDDSTGLFGLFKKKSMKHDIEEEVEKIKVRPVLSESVIRDMHDSDTFLNDEITIYHDVRPIIQDTTVTKDEESSTEKSKEKHKEGSAGLFGLLKKKPSKEREIKEEVEKTKDKLVLSESVIRDMQDSDAFLSDEIKIYHDVRPVVQEEVTSKEEKTSIEQSKEKQTDDSTGLFGLFKKKSKKNIVEEEVEKIKVRPVLSESVIRDMHDSDTFLNDEITIYHDVRPIIQNTTVTKDEESSTEKSKEKHKEDSAGLFGLLKKKSSKEREIKEEVEKTKDKLVLSESVIRDMQDSDAFLSDEIKIYHDVRPVVQEEVTSKEEKTSIEQSKEKQTDESTGLFGLFKKKSKKHDIEEEVEKINVGPVFSESVIRDMHDSDTFLNDEITIYHDVRPIIQDTSVTKDEESSTEKSKEKHKEGSAGLFGLLKKKSSKEREIKEEVEKTKDKPVLSESVIKDMQDSDAFLSDEIKIYHDVRPVVQEEVISKEEKTSIEQSKEKQTDDSTGLFGLFKKKSKKHDIEKVEKIKDMPVLSESVIRDMHDSDTFLKDEINIYHDVRPIIQETAVLKVTDTSTEKLKEKYTDDSTRSINSIENKSPEEREIDEILSKKLREEPKDDRTRFFGIFKKKSVEREADSNAAKITETPLSSENTTYINETDLFLEGEIQVYDDVRPIIRETVTEIEVQTPTEKSKRERKADETGFFGLFKKKSSEERDDVKSSTEKMVKDSHLKQKEKDKKTPKSRKSKKIELRKDVIEQHPLSVTDKTVEQDFNLVKTDEIAKVEDEKDKTESDAEVKNIHETTNFLNTELERYEDAKLIPKTELKIEEFLELPVEIKQDKDMLGTIQSEHIPGKSGKIFGIFSKRKSQDRESSVESDKKVEKKKEKDKKKQKSEEKDLQTSISNETRIPANQEICLQSDTSGDKSGSKDFLKGEIDRYHDAENKIENLTEVLSPETDEQSKEKSGGFFGLFSKKTKPQEKSVTEKSEDSKYLPTVDTKVISDSDNFIQNEINKYEDSHSHQPITTITDTLQPIQIFPIHRSSEALNITEPNAVIDEVAPKIEKASTIKKEVVIIKNVELDPRVLTDLSKLEEEIKLKIDKVRDETEIFNIPLENTDAITRTELKNVEQISPSIKTNLSDKVKDVDGTAKTVDGAEEMSSERLAEDTNKDAAYFLKEELNQHEDEILPEHKQPVGKDKEKKTGIFKIFGKKRSHDRESSEEKYTVKSEEQTDLESSKAKKEERKKSSTPFKIFGNKQLAEEDIKYIKNYENINYPELGGRISETHEQISEKLQTRDTKPTVESEIALENIQDTQRFLSVELENYEDGKPEIITDLDEDVERIKSSGLFGIFSKKEKSESPKIKKRKLRKPKKSLDEVQDIKIKKVSFTDEKDNNVENVEMIPESDFTELNIEEIEKSKIRPIENITIEKSFDGTNLIGKREHTEDEAFFAHIEEEIKERTEDINRSLKETTDKTEETIKDIQTTVKDVKEVSLKKTDETKQMAEEITDDGKTTVGKTIKKTSGLISKLGDKIGGKSEISKDNIRDKKEESTVIATDKEESKDKTDVLKKQDDDAIDTKYTKDVTDSKGKKNKKTKKSFFSKLGERIGVKGEDVSDNTEQLQKNIDDSNIQSKEFSTEIFDDIVTEDGKDIDTITEKAVQETVIRSEKVIPSEDIFRVGSSSFVAEIMQSFDDTLEHVKEEGKVLQDNSEENVITSIDAKVENLDNTDTKKQIGTFLQQVDEKFSATIKLTEEMSKDAKQKAKDSLQETQAFLKGERDSVEHDITSPIAVLSTKPKAKIIDNGTAIEVEEIKESASEFADRIKKQQEILEKGIAIAVQNVEDVAEDSLKKSQDMKVSAIQACEMSKNIIKNTEEGIKYKTTDQTKQGEHFLETTKVEGTNDKETGDIKKHLEDNKKSVFEEHEQLPVTSSLKINDDIKDDVDKPSKKTKRFLGKLGRKFSGKGEELKGSSYEETPNLEGTKQISDKKQKKSTGFFSKLGDKISGKSEECKKDVEKDRSTAECSVKTTVDDMISHVPDVKVVIKPESPKERVDIFYEQDTNRIFQDVKQTTLDFIETECLNIDDNKMTRTMSDYGSKIKDSREESPRKISEANIDLSNLPTNVEEYSKQSERIASSYVTSPNLARRTVSQRFPKGERPEVIEVTYFDNDNNSDDELYIVTEPDDTLTQREKVDLEQQNRKPLFHLESEDDDNSEAINLKLEMERQDSSKSNVLETLTELKIDTLISDLTKSLNEAVEMKTPLGSEIKKEEKRLEEHKKESQAEVDLIEKKLSDIDKALESLEQIDAQTETEGNKDNRKSEKKLRRVERKFERMASEVIDKDVKDGKTLQMTSPEVEQKQETEYRKLVSQLSTEEISDFQKEYSHLWDDNTFSKSDDWDSKTPDSQADVQELSQGGEEATSSATQQPSTSVRAQVTRRRPLRYEISIEDQTEVDPREHDWRFNLPKHAEGEEAEKEETGFERVTDQHQLSEEMKELLKELEKESKQ